MILLEVGLAVLNLFLTSMCSNGSSEVLSLIFFPFTALWGIAVDHFGAHYKPGTLPANVRKQSIYSCVGYL